MSDEKSVHPLADKVEELEVTQEERSKASHLVYLLLSGKAILVRGAVEGLDDLPVAVIFTVANGGMVPVALVPSNDLVDRLHIVNPETKQMGKLHDMMPHDEVDLGELIEERQSGNPRPSKETDKTSVGKTLH